MNDARLNLLVKQAERLQRDRLLLIAAEGARCGG
jgi:hypothetical protein